MKKALERVLGVSKVDVRFCRMVSTYKGNGVMKNFSTSYLVGVKNGRYYITLASPQTTSP